MAYSLCAVISSSSCEMLDGKEIKVKEILDFQTWKIIKSLHHWIYSRETFKNLCCSQAAENVNFDVLCEWFKAIEDFHIHSGRTTEIKRNKKKKPTEYTINFTHFGCLKFHIEKIIDKDKLGKYFQKENKSEAKPKVVITEEKPAIMSYKLSTGSLILSVNYGMGNHYGMVYSC